MNSEWDTIESSFRLALQDIEKGNLDGARLLHGIFLRTAITFLKVGEINKYVAITSFLDMLRLAIYVPGVASKMLDKDS